MERAFRAWCKQQLAISNAVGERIYPMQAPQTAPLPRMVYQEISSVPLLSQDKFSGSQTSRLQITVHASDYGTAKQLRSEEHTSELQSQSNLVCRLLLEKKKKELTN